jgi:hypothetical protein
MVLIVRSQVPPYLQGGEFFASLSTDDDASGEIEIPDGVTKPDTGIKNVADLAFLFKSLRFWLVITIPEDASTFLLEHFELCGDVCAEFGRDFPILTILETVYTTPDNDKMSVAIKSGSMEVIVMLIKSGFVTQSCHLGEAALAGHLHVLTFLHGRHRMSSNTAQNAAQGGHITCLKYALENGCAMNKQLVNYAAAGGSVACLSYLVNRGCELTLHVALTAGKEGHVGCL